MSTTVLKRSLAAPRWGDDSLNQCLLRWTQTTPLLETHEILKRLLDITFVLPVESFQAGEYAIVLKTVDLSGGGCMLPSFTQPALLSDFARAKGWIKPGTILPSHRMEAKELFDHVSKIVGVILGVNPDGCKLTLTDGDCERLKRGELPDVGKTVLTATQVASTVAQRGLDMAAATDKVPAPLLDALRGEFLQLKFVSYAALFTLGAFGPSSCINLGIKCTTPRSAEIDQLIQKLQIMIFKSIGSTPRVKVLLLEDPLEPQIAKRIDAFYKRYELTR